MLLSFWIQLLGIKEDLGRSLIAGAKPGMELGTSSRQTNPDSNIALWSSNAIACISVQSSGIAPANAWGNDVVDVVEDDDDEELELSLTMFLLSVLEVWILVLLDTALLH